MMKMMMTKVGKVTRRRHNEQESLQSDTRTHALWHECLDYDEDECRKYKHTNKNTH